MKYREHRGSLSDSMKTLKEFKSLEELHRHIQSVWGMDIKVEDISFNYSCYDKRINWNTYYVCLKTEYSEHPHCIGMSDGILTGETSK